MMSANDYKNWLEKCGYQTSTVRNSTSGVHRAEALWAAGDPIPSAYDFLLKRYARFLVETVDMPARLKGLEGFDGFVLKNYEASRVEREKFRSRKKTPLSARELARLTAAIQRGEKPEDEVLLFLLAAPDIEPRALLRAPIADVMRKLESVPELRAKLAQIRKVSSSLSDHLCRSGIECAYRRLFRRLQAHAAELGLEVDFLSLDHTPANVRAKAAVA